LSESVMAI